MSDQRVEGEAAPASEDLREEAGRTGTPRAITGFHVLIAHLTWFIIGPLILFLLLLGILQAGTGWATVLDVVYFVLLPVMVIARWFDQRSGQGTTSTGEPSTWEDFRRWALIFPGVAVAAWVVANLLGNHMQ